MILLIPTVEDLLTQTKLLENRIDPDKPTTYISATSDVNYESRNPLEFGDEGGYNETLERLAVEGFKDNITYVHLPMAGFFAYILVSSL